MPRNKPPDAPAPAAKTGSDVQMAEADAPALMTQAEYARHRGVDRAHICRLVAARRLAMVDDLIDATASDQILGKPAADAETSDDQQPGTDHSRAQLRLLEAQAALAEMKLKERGGQLIERESASRAVADLCAALREKFVAVPVTIADRVVNLKTPREISTIIAAALEDELKAFAEDMARAFGEVSTDAVQAVPGERDEDDSAGDVAGPPAAPAPLPE